MKAVVWTDSLQTVIMATGVLLVFITSLVESGGIQRAWEIGTEHRRTDIFE